jgi:hypothetical protein
VIVGLQDRFLHTLTHHQAVAKWELIEQRKCTIQEHLNELTKYAARMLYHPDLYSFRWQFIRSLQPSLCTGVTRFSWTAEEHTLGQLVKMASRIEHAGQYDSELAEDSSMALPRPQTEV